MKAGRVLGVGLMVLVCIIFTFSDALSYPAAVSMIILSAGIGAALETSAPSWRESHRRAKRRHDD